ncbi:MAG: hypothetical protein V7754_11675 [Halioglobus sp.]
MDYLRLAVALFLPWLAGYYWLAAIEAKFSATKKANTLRQIAYGLFLGYAGLQAIVLTSNTLFQQLHFWPVLAVLMALTLAGAWARNRTVKSRTATPADPALSSRASRILLAVLLGWISLHLILVAIEILYRPVFPWDAWLNWIYRAKAWFYSGAIAPMDYPGQWFNNTGSAAYNVVGNQYPSFTPLIALWSATALGYWSETLVNLPVLLCGIALGMGLYGQCRELGMSKLLSTLAAYLLLSLPMIGAHLALAGQADIWVAGFTGLGIIAIVHGLARPNRFQVLLGLTMTALAMGIKAEATIWLGVALATIALAYRPRLCTAILGALIALGSIAWLANASFMTLPGGGGLGYLEGRIHLPLLGDYALRDFDLWDDYLDNFFQNGSWHILWPLLALAGPALFLIPGSRTRRSIISFAIVFAAVQAFIFDYTEHGQWAEDYTAINRLPMHFAPAIVFCLMLLIQALGRHFAYGVKSPTLNNPENLFEPRAKQTGMAIVTGSVVTLVGLLAYLMLMYPAGDGSTRTFSAAQLRVVVGGGQVQGEKGIISRFDNNIAIVSSGPLTIDTTDFQVLEIESGGENKNSPTFFWRPKDDASNVKTLKTHGKGAQSINLSTAKAWSGIATEVGLLFYNDEGKAAEISRLTLKPRSITSNLHALWAEWTQFVPWSEKSAHWISSGATRPMVSLPVLITAWLLACTLALLVVYRSASAAFVPICCCAVAAWMVLDARWTGNTAVQAVKTARYYQAAQPAHINNGGDLEVAKLIQQIRPLIEQPDSKILIVATKTEMRFNVQRAKYHLLPLAGLVYEGDLESIPKDAPFDYLLVIKQRFLEPGEAKLTPANLIRRIDVNSTLNLVLKSDTDEGALFVVQ